MLKHEGFFVICKKFKVSTEGNRHNIGQEQTLSTIRILIEIPLAAANKKTDFAKNQIS